MPSNINFVKAFIRKAEIKPSEVGAIVRIHLTAEYTEAVLDAMDWTDPGESTKKDEMIGQLAAGNFILTPDSDMLKQHEMQFSFFGAEKFYIMNIVKDEERRREFRFFVDSNAPEAAALVFAYIAALKKQTGNLKLSYTPQDDLNLG